MNKPSTSDQSPLATAQARSTHTPGPWHVQAGTCICAGDIILTRTLEAHSEMGDGNRFHETRANARLIAAAPDLLESLTNLVGLAEMRGRIDEYKAALDDARAAIKKARG